VRTDAVVAQVILETECRVGFDGVRAFVLKFIRAQLVEQADTASFLIEIDDHATPFRIESSASLLWVANRSRSDVNERRRQSGI
jgi:hypothetical protein